MSLAQNQVKEELQNLLDDQKYQQLLGKYEKILSDLDGEELYYVGMAYYMLEQDDKCLEVMDLAIQSDSTLARPIFIKGMTNYYKGNLNESISLIKQAIKVDPSHPDFYEGLGNLKASLNDYESALTNFRLAVEMDKDLERSYIMIPQMLAALGRQNEALREFYVAKERITTDNPSYITVIYNIAVFEYLNSRYKVAEEYFKKLLMLKPDDFQATAKLIQVYYALDDIEKAVPLKQKLYVAYEKGLLQDNMKEMFCFDQFKWKNKSVQVYERFKDIPGKLYYKHLFYIINESGDIEFRIQTENSPVSVELGGPKFILGMTHNDGVHSNFGFGFPEDFEYSELKKAVIGVLEKRITAAATTVPAKNKND
jgi:tetratricopeptide (TPR) repeat protein